MVEQGVPDGILEKLNIDVKILHIQRVPLLSASWPTQFRVRKALAAEKGAQTIVTMGAPDELPWLL
jgi:hypothetical protein